MAFETKVESLSKTFFNQVMQRGSFFDVPATRYGKDIEPITRESFTEYISKHHEHVLVLRNGATRSSKLTFLLSKSRWHRMLLLS